jgi:hypothetical protein
MSYFDWPIAKKVQIIEAPPKIKDYIERCSASPFGPPI